MDREREGGRDGRKGGGKIVNECMYIHCRSSISMQLMYIDFYT